MALQYLAVLAGEQPSSRFAPRRKTSAFRPALPVTPAARSPQSDWTPRVAPKKKKMGFFASLFASRSTPKARTSRAGTLSGAHAIQDAVLRRR